MIAIHNYFVRQNNQRCNTVNKRCEDFIERKICFLVNKDIIREWRATFFLSSGEIHKIGFVVYIAFTPVFDWEYSFTVYKTPSLMVWGNGKRTGHWLILLQSNSVKHVFNWAFIATILYFSTICDRSMSSSFVGCLHFKVICINFNKDSFIWKPQLTPVSQDNLQIFTTKLERKQISNLSDYGNYNYCSVLAF